MSKKQDPVDLNTLYAEAVSLHQQNKPDEAIGLYSLVVSHLPEVAEVHYNLGLAFYETKQFTKAARAYTKAADLCPDDEDIFYNLGLAYKKAERFAEAEQAYLKALTLAPSDPEVYYNLGCCYRDAGEIKQALKVFGKLVKMVPDHLPGLNNRAYLYHLMGEYDQAREGYKQILKLDPEHASARYMHAVLVGAPVDVPPQEYITSLFDHYSDTFEEHLIEDLDYNLYLDLRVQFDAVEEKKRLYDHCLDLGCGTGLAGEAFRTACVKLSGVDLSAKMIAQAEAKQIYNTLHVDDIIKYLCNSDTRFDLFVATDVLIYLGDLHPLFQAAARRSAPGALFCLSTEKTLENEWVIKPTGRYAHHPDYVRTTAAKSGWKELLCVETKSRREADSWIHGNLFVLAREV